jgi:hypothetical protein
MEQNKSEVKKNFIITFPIKLFAFCFLVGEFSPTVEEKTLEKKDYLIKHKVIACV